MKIHHALVIPVLLLSLGISIAAQEKDGREMDIQKNVRLIEMPVPQDMPEPLRGVYQKFLPLFEAALKENAPAQTAEAAVTFRTAPGIKEIGAAKTRRAIATITAYRKDSKTEYVATLLLYNYATGDIVDKNDIVQFLRIQILTPLGLYQEAKQ